VFNSLKRQRSLSQDAHRQSFANRGEHNPQQSVLTIGSITAHLRILINKTMARVQSQEGEQRSLRMPNEHSSNLENMRTGSSSPLSQPIEPQNINNTRRLNAIFNQTVTAFIPPYQELTLSEHVTLKGRENDVCPITHIAYSDIIQPAKLPGQPHVYEYTALATGLNSEENPRKNPLTRDQALFTQIIKVIWQ